jgi:hypothetical protein
VEQVRMAHILRAHTSWSRVVQTKCLTFQAKWIKIDHLDKNRSQENNCAEDTTVIVIVIIAKYKDHTVIFFKKYYLQTVTNS